KYKKLAGRGGGHLWSQLLGRLRQENGVIPKGGACSEPRSHHCTPAWATKRDSVSKKEKRKKKERKKTTLTVSQSVLKIRCEKMGSYPLLKRTSHTNWKEGKILKR
uniref:Uncharacterized protein n=1 Tax=Macaca mulatta TaxID=9544 RepID=A0A5F8AE02_MACMU